MSERRENRGMASLRRRQIEIRGDVELRPALERQLLDAIAVPLHRARDAWIQRSPLQGPTEHLPDLFGHDSLTLEDGLRRGNRVDQLLAPATCLACDTDEVSLEIMRVIR